MPGTNMPKRSKWKNEKKASVRLNSVDADRKKKQYRFNDIKGSLGLNKS